MKIRGIDFVGLEVDDMQQATKFYEDTLGLSVYPGVVSDGWTEFSTPHVALALSHLGLGAGSVRIAFAVDDISEAVEELRSKGIDVTGPDESEVCYWASFKDPSGHDLLLHQRKDGSCGP